jgi:AI-2 transport protein TqsA
MSTITKTASLFFLGLVAMLTLYYGRSLMIPFVLALLIWFLINEILIRLEKVSFISKYIPAWVRTVLVILILFRVDWACRTDSEQQYSNLDWFL